MEENSFNELKNYLTTAPILLLPDPNKQFTVTTDASDFAIGAILSQDQGKGQQPVAYESRKLTSAEQNYLFMKRNYLLLYMQLNFGGHTWKDNAL